MKELFDITKIIFERPNEWSTVTKGEKKKYFFALNRRFAIQFPMQANALQSIKINQSGVIDFWQVFLSKQYPNRRTPSWMFTKGIKKSKVIKEKKTNVSESLIYEYSKQMQIDKKSVYDALEFFPSETTKEIKAFEKIINNK